MSRIRQFSKWFSIAVAVLLLLLGAAVVGLDIWLARSPELAPRLVARIEVLTGLRFSYDSLTARLGFYGPELVFTNASITLKGQRSAVVSARSGRVGLDLWRALRTLHPSSVRVVLDGARLYAFLTQNGIELRGGPMSDDDTHIPLDQVPIGHVQIENSTVTVRDLRTEQPAWKVDRVAIDLARDPQQLRLATQVRLPESLASGVSAELALEGDLKDPSALRWSSHLDLKKASLAGWTALLPRWTVPLSGHGDLSATVNGRGTVIDHVATTLALRDVAGPDVDGVTAPRFPTLAGSIIVDRDGAGWRAEGSRITIDPGHDPWRRGEFEFRFAPGAADGGVFRLRSSSVHLDAIGALASLLPSGRGREMGLALAPRGQLNAVDVAITHDIQRGWRMNGGAQFTRLSIGAFEAIPGLTGISGSIAGAGAYANGELHSSDMTLDLARVMREPIPVEQLQSKFKVAWQEDGWRFELTDTSLATLGAHAQGSAHVFLPADPQASSDVQLDFRFGGLQAINATRYLPGKKLPAPVMDWLDHAFLAGSVSEGQAELSGDLKRFPFRDGGGLFRIAFNFEHLRLHFHDAFGDLEELSGDAEFKNSGFTGRTRGGHAHGILIRQAVAGMEDFKEAELTADAKVEGDVHDALAYLQNSLVGPKLGPLFMKLGGKGPMSGDLKLVLPFRHFADRLVAVDARIDHAQIKAPGLDEPARDVTGGIVIRNRDVNASKITATVLGGPARFTVKMIGGKGLEHALTVTGDGKVLADHVQAAFGIDHGVWMNGAADWSLLARFPRLEWQPPPEPVPPGAPPDARPTVHEVETHWGVGAIQVQSTLQGLALGFPAPLNKAVDAGRLLRAEISIDFPVDDSTAVPPGMRREANHPLSVTLRSQFGRDSAAFEWRAHEDEVSLHRGILHFGNGSALLREGRGVWIDGRLPDYDLSAWLRVRLREKPGSALASMLAGSQLQVEHFNIFGFRFPDVSLALSAGNDAWRVAVEGPAARGTIVVPYDLRGAEPLTLDMERLLIGEHAGGSTPDGDDETDPTQLPPIAIKVRNLEVQKRRFGSLEAALSRAPDGLLLDRAVVHGNSFEATAKGSWTSGPAGQSSSLNFVFDSTDMQDTLNAWGFQQTLTGKRAHAAGTLGWPGSLDLGLFARATGHVKIEVEQGQVLGVSPGAGRVLGLLSIAALPRRLTLDFSDLTDKGFAFDHIRGDFAFKGGNAYTQNLVLKGPAAEIGIVGRTGLLARDYDQTAKITGHVGGPIAAAGALAAGPAIGAALLLFSSVFKEPLGGMARGYYRITGSWDKPAIERIGASEAREVTGKAPVADPVPETSPSNPETTESVPLPPDVPSEPRH
jgi:hypothetical protein